MFNFFHKKTSSEAKAKKEDFPEFREETQVELNILAQKQIGFKKK